MTGDIRGRNPALPVLTSDLESPRNTEDIVGVIDRRFSLSELLDISAFRDVCASFVELYKIGIKIFDLDGTKLVDIRVGNGDWCGYIFQNAEGRQRCTGLVSRIKQFEYPGLLNGEVVEQTCFSGLKYVIMPVHYGGDMLGRVVYGPFLPTALEKPGEAVFNFEGDFDPQKLWKYGAKVRRASDEMIIKILNNFRGVVDTITFIAIKALMTQQLHLASITDSYNKLTESNMHLRTSLEKLKELDRLKSNFLAMISHELRTPLTSVIGYSEMLLEGFAGDMPDEQKSYVSTIKDKGESLLELIGSLLDMSKIEAGAMNLSLSDIELPSLLEAAKTYVVPQTTKKGIRLLVQCAVTRPFRADRDKLRQSLINLLGNAVKFTGQGGEIRMHAEDYFGPRRFGGDSGRFGPPDEHFVRINVEDTGVGIPADKLEKVFNSFYQVDNSVTREYGGTGLGLAIVKRFVEAHRGEVWVESREGKGTCFSILIPLEGIPDGSVPV